MKNLFLLSFCILGFVAVAGPAGAATANFQVNCASGIPTNCVLDPNRTPSGQTATSCPMGHSVTQYFVDWGDGTSYYYTPPPHQTSHIFLGASSNNICLTVFCSDGSSTIKCHCFSNTVGIGGCVRPGAGWTP
jgi:hypothetical protein